MKKVPLELIGLLTLAKAHNVALEEIAEEAKRITGEKDQWGHCSDIVWSHIADHAPEAAARELWERTVDCRDVHQSNQV
jgi:hypothetical protein